MSDEIRKDDEMDNEQNTPDAVEPADMPPPPFEPPPTTGGDDPSPWGMNRRDVVKALATVPFVGALGYQAFRKSNIQDEKRDAIANEVHPADDGVLIYTSGTTAHPKGVLHRQRAPVIHDYLETTLRDWTASRIAAISVARTGVPHASDSITAFCTTQSPFGSS